MPVHNQLQTNDLSGFKMYASGEPCAMCLTAMYFTGIEDIYFCQSVDDANKVGLGKSKFIYEELKKPREQRQLNIKQMKLTANQVNPMQLWNEK